MSFLVASYYEGEPLKLQFGTFKDAYKFAMSLTRYDCGSTIRGIYLTSGWEKLEIRMRKYVMGYCIILRDWNTLRSTMYIKRGK